MQFTENFQLPCPDDTDYGAIALLMQRTALDIEGLLLGQQTSFEQFNEQPTSVWIRNTDTLSIPSSGTTEVTWSLTSSTVFRNYSSTATSLFSGVPTPGIYHLGFYVNTTCVGAVTNDSFRQVVFEVFRRAPVGEEPVATYSRIIQEENIAGGNFFGTEGVVVIGTDFSNYNFRATFSHGNAGSNMLVAAGATAWFTRIGLNEVIEVS